MSRDIEAVRRLTGNEDFDTVVWDERVDLLVPNAAMVDVVVSSKPGALVSLRTTIALVWLPNGPVARGVQNYTEGQQVNFRNVPVKAGARLALVTNANFANDVPAFYVDVVPSGGGAAVEAERRGQQQTVNPIGALENAATGVGVVLGLFVAVLIWKEFFRK